MAKISILLYLKYLSQKNPVIMTSNSANTHAHANSLKKAKN